MSNASLLTNKEFYERYKDDYAAHGGGAWLILMERIRHYEVEGFDENHDEEHRYGELAKGGACYAVNHTDAEVLEQMDNAWPWDEMWWKPSDDPIKNLIKSGGLIAAEIDRLIAKKERETGEKFKLNPHA